ncbi:MAG TPA: cytochrome c [Casimicrobiaceae bacterium]|nr:cytochrome c [Casimicrobiaceae bacterium]
MNRTMLVAALLAAVLPVAEAIAQGAPQGAPVGDAGRAKTQMCQGCHGIDGWRTAYPEVYTVPKLGNQHQSYLVTALQEYKNGQRSHPSMRAIAASLSDQDMADLAAYYAQSGEKMAGK